MLFFQQVWNFLNYNLWGADINRIWVIIIPAIILVVIIIYIISCNVKGHKVSIMIKLLFWIYLLYELSIIIYLIHLIRNYKP